MKWAIIRGVHWPDIYLNFNERYSGYMSKEVCDVVEDSGIFVIRSSKASSKYVEKCKQLF